MRRIVTEKILEEMVNDYHNGMDLSELANKYNFRKTTIQQKMSAKGIYKNIRHNYTCDEIEKIKQYYVIGDWESIRQLFPDLSKSAIQRKMSRLGISMDCIYWTKDEDDILKKNYLYKNIEKISNMLGERHTYNAIYARAEKLGLKTREYWTDEEIEILKLYYNFLSIDEILALLPNRNRDTIITKASQLGLSKERKNYSEYEIEYIKENALTMSDIDIGMKLGRSEKAITSKRKSLGITVPKQTPMYVNLKKYIRGRITKWKIDSLKNCNYKCVLTGDTDIAIHHIHAFSLIFDELVDTYKIPVKDNLSEYTLQELEHISCLFNSIQSKYPLGVCIRKDLHFLFHSEYGQGNNTESQWNDFVDNFKSGKYNYQIINSGAL